MKYLIIVVWMAIAPLGACAQKEGDKLAVALSDKEKPKYPGGEPELKKYLSLNLRYPHLAMEQKVEGEVIISFVINTEGTVSDISVLKGIGYGCDEEAIRVVKAMPQWQPARKKGAPLKVAYRLPIVFELPQSTTPDR